MTPKQKAKELVNLFYTRIENEVIDFLSNKEINRIAKDCALHCANEFTSFQMIFANVFCIDDFTKEHKSICEFWQDVKEEIENL